MLLSFLVCEHKSQMLLNINNFKLTTKNNSFSHVDYSAD